MRTGSTGTRKRRAMATHGHHAIKIRRGQHHRLLMNPMRKFAEAMRCVDALTRHQRVIAQVIDEHVRMKAFASRTQTFDKARGHRRRKCLERVEHRRCERSFGGRQAGRHAHQDREDHHRLRDDLQRLKPVEVVANPVGGNGAAHHAGGDHQTQSDGHDPAVVDAPQIQYGSRQPAARQQRNRDQQRQRRGLQRPVRVNPVREIGRVSRPRRPAGSPRRRVS